MRWLAPGEYFKSNNWILDWLIPGIYFPNFSECCWMKFLKLFQSKFHFVRIDKSKSACLFISKSNLHF